MYSSIQTLQNPNHEHLDLLYCNDKHLNVRCCNPVTALHIKCACTPVSRRYRTLTTNILTSFYCNPKPRAKAAQASTDKEKPVAAKVKPRAKAPQASTDKAEELAKAVAEAAKKQTAPGSKGKRRAKQTAAARKGVGTTAQAKPKAAAAQATQTPETGEAKGEGGTEHRRPRTFRHVRAWESFELASVHIYY
jgi:hypothetical protein